MSEHSSFVFIHRRQRRRERLGQSSFTAATYFDNTHTHTHIYLHTHTYTHTPAYTYTHTRIDTHIHTHTHRKAEREREREREKERERERERERDIKRSGFAVLRQKTFVPKIVVLRESNTNSDFVFVFDMSYI